MKQIVLIIFGFLILFFSVPSAKAATLFLEPLSGAFGPNSIFEEKILLKLDPGECINAGQFIIDFPNDVLEAKDFDTGNSVFSLWIKKPENGDFEKINQTGKISFIGGLPGGFCGQILSNEPYDGQGGQEIGSIIFSVKKPIISDEADIGFSSLSQAFLNNDQGIETDLSFQNSHLKIDKNITRVIDEWQEKISNDKTPPENFTIDLSRDENIFNGQYFLSFSTVDRQTGVGHYEVLEISPQDLAAAEGKVSALTKISNKILKRETPGLSWQRATSPYLLKDQTLKNIIKVKAVDKAGNERIVEFTNAAVRAVAYGSKFTTYLIWAQLGVIAVLLGIIVLLIIRNGNHRAR